MQTLILILLAVLVAINVALSLLLLRRYRLLNHWTSWIAQDYTDLLIYIRNLCPDKHDDGANSSDNGGENGDVK